MRRCLLCQTRFDDGRLVCTADGDLLIEEGRAVAETGQTISVYQVGNLLGEGGMGRVFEARHLVTDEPVALKVMKVSAAASDTGRLQAARRFEVEAEAGHALDHPGIVRVLDSGTTAFGEPFMVMERLYGSTFEELRRAGKLADPGRVVALLRDVCEILSTAHERGIVHRDLKPSNLFLHRPDPATATVKLLDFGIARILGREGEKLTSTGEFVGTLNYLAPELVSGGTVTRAADVYSLGVILFEMLAGRVPFSARSPIEVLRQHASSMPPALSLFCPEVSDELDHLVARCLLKRPEHRFGDAGEVGRALAALKPVREPGLVRGAGLAATLRDMPRSGLGPARWVGVVLEERYVIEEWIGRGRFQSDVFRARHLRTEAQVAVRLWRLAGGAARDTLLQVFRREARTMGLRHPSLITVLDLGHDDECIYLVTELVASISLRQLISRGPLPSLARSSTLLCGAAEALGALHEKGLVSGGLSPETIRVTQKRDAATGRDEPQALLLSPFGLGSFQELVALLGSAVGEGEDDRALEFIAPEQRAGAAPDARSDLWSLGMIAVELVGGRAPRPSRTTTRTQTMVAMDAASPGSERLDALELPKDLPASWYAFLHRAVAQELNDRFQSAAELIAALPRT